MTTVEVLPEVKPLVRKESKMMSGDEAVAWAGVDAGVCISTAYPGTPATDIQEALELIADERVKIVWSVNEKVAYETALAGGIAGVRAMVSMKQVGVNVAADAFMNSCPAGTNAGLVLVVGDDPECHSSQNKQDTRHYATLSGTLIFEPGDAQEAYSMTREAFRVSEKYGLPVMVRLTVRTAHAFSAVKREPRDSVLNAFNWPRKPERFFIVPTVSRRLFLRLAELQPVFARDMASGRFSSRQDANDGSLGILCTGTGYPFACEFAPEGAGILKVAGEPFPDEDITSFVNAHRKIIVLEEGDPILERRARNMSRGAIVLGRLSGDLKPVGELQAEQIEALINGKPVLQKAAPKFNLSELPPRLPEICKPCGYHKVFGALKELEDIATPSDIGCNSLGGLPPYSVMDGVWAMGSSIGVGCGLAALGHKRVVAIIGDSTFFHAGLPPLVEAVHEGYTMTVLLLDNGTAAMTGGQGVAHIPQGQTQRKVDMVKVIEAIGVASCTPFDPHKLGRDGIRQLIEDSFGQPGVKVLLYRSQCGLYSPGYAGSVAPAELQVEPVLKPVPMLNQ